MKLGRIAGWSAGAVALGLVAAAIVAYAASDNDCARATAPRGAAMKAIVRCEYGGPDVLRLADVEKPSPADDQVCVRVRAAAVNPLDWHVLRGEPYVARLDMGLRVPKTIAMGVDFAGTVESVGRNVRQLRPGDAVFGGRDGALGEYVCVREDRAIAPKPPDLSFEEAAAVPVAAITALQALRDQGRVRAGQKVLVNGASGGVGTFAVQLAKVMGAEVTGVCSTRNVELVRSLGADRVVDYTREDFTQRGERYDVVVDNVGNHSLLALRRVLVPGGRYVMVGGEKGRWFAPLPRALRAHVLSWLVDEHMGFFIARLGKDDLLFLGELLAQGRIRPVLDRRYPLGEAAEAIRYLEQGRARGKVIVTVE